MLDAPTHWKLLRVMYESQNSLQEEEQGDVKGEANVYWPLTPLGKGGHPHVPGLPMQACPADSHRHLTWQHQEKVGRK